jgi:[ribosomal protein S18]-alanine N-acetyltransferase
VADAPTHLRPYQRSDFEELYRIDHACFPKGIAYERVELNLYLSAPGAYCLLAEISGAIAGFILTDHTEKRAHVITIDVLEAYRRKHLGSLLLDAAEREAAGRGVPRMWIETATNNKPAIAFWRKHGYLDLGIIKNYYGPGRDAFEMEKLLIRREED